MADVSLNLEETRSLLRQIIRTIDKKVEFTLDMVEGDQPAVWVSLALRGNKGKVHLTPPLIKAAATDAVRRNDVRIKLKREIEGMGFKESKINDTKMLRGQPMDSSFFRGPGNRPGGGRR